MEGVCFDQVWVVMVVEMNESGDDVMMVDDDDVV